MIKIKSLLTSLYEREGEYPSLKKRDKGRFSGKCIFNYVKVSNSCTPPRNGCLIRKKETHG